MMGGEGLPLFVQHVWRTEHGFIYGDVYSYFNVI